MIKNLRILTAVVTLMVVIDALMVPGVLLWVTIDRDGYLRVTGGTDGITAIAYSVVILTMILFSVWIYVAGKNLQDANLDLEFTPGSRIWWFAVPIACLFKPFQGMRELWNASHGIANYEENNALVTTWWAVFLGCGFASYILNAVASEGGGSGPLWIESALLVTRGALAIAMIRGIAIAQGQTLSGGHLEEVFA
jgi:hypothetical protein